MGDTAWKRAERRFARLFGAERRPLSGSAGASAGGGTDDSNHDRLYLEHKYSSGSSAAWSLYDKVRVKAREEGRVPVIGLTRRRSPGVLLVIHSEDLEDFIEACERSE